jgi:hypothetical protein
MGRTLICRETPIEYFKKQVEAALEHQHLDAGELTSYYVVRLLADFAARRRRDISDQPLAVRLARAAASGGTEWRSGLREVGDVALFVAGFFSDSLNRKIVDLDYYIALGGYAYGSLSRQEEETFAEAYGELSEKFVAFVDVLSEVSEQSGLAPNSDLLRLYEKWLRTGGRRDGARLVERGIVPNRSIGSRFVQ